MFPTYKGFCFHGPFYYSVDIIFPFFATFLETFFSHLYLGLAVLFAVGYAAFMAHDIQHYIKVPHYIKLFCHKQGKYTTLV